MTNYAVYEREVHGTEHLIYLGDVEASGPDAGLNKAAEMYPDVGQLVLIPSSSFHFEDEDSSLGRI
jgi:hypothetical protein